MIDSANIRRRKALRRIFLSQRYYVLGAPRRPLVRLAYLACMNETMHPFPGLEPVLTTSELAAHLGVPVQTLHDLRHTGRGPRGFRVGRELRYRLSEIQNWLAQLEQADKTDHAAERSGR